MSVRSGMRRPAARTAVPLVVGVLLVCVGVYLGLSRLWEDMRANAASEAILAELEHGAQAAEDPSSTDMATQQVDGADYLGVLTVPSADIHLPVAAACTDELLRKSPCRYAGSYLTGDLIVCGEGYESHFGRLSSAGIGDAVLFAPVGGEELRYVVSNVGTEPLEDLDAILHDWDLTLFTFNADDTCCVVRCVVAGPAQG